MSNTKGFAELIEDAQRIPGGPSNAPPEITSPFCMPLPADHRVVNNVEPGKAPGVTEFDYDAEVEVLCLNQPADRLTYVGILNKCLNGKAILRYEDRTVTKEGDSMVTICWLTPKPRPPKSKLASFRGSAEDED
jgi:hypothetical protein